MSAPSIYFDEARYGWVRYGNFFPYEVWGDGPFFHDAVQATAPTKAEGASK